MYYSVQSETNSNKTGIIFMICGIIIAGITYFIQLYLSGKIVLTDEQFITCVSIFSGLLTDVIILCFTVPKFHLALHSHKVSGRIIDIEEHTGTYRTSSGSIRHCTVYTPVLEYSVNGEKFSGIKLNVSTTNKPVIGESVKLHVSNSDFSKVIDTKQIVFLIFAAIIFLLMGCLFALPGIIYLVNGNVNNFTITTVKDTGDTQSYALLSMLIGGGFALVFFLIGLIICVCANSKKALVRSGVKNICKITDVKVNLNTIINGKNPVRITCRNSSGNFFYGKTTAEPDTYRLNQTIDVYSLADNSEKYYVDFDSVR